MRNVGSYWRRAYHTGDEDSRNRRHASVGAALTSSRPCSGAGRSEVLVLNAKLRHALVESAVQEVHPYHRFNFC